MKVIQYIRVNHYFRNVVFVSSVVLFILATLLCLPISISKQDSRAATNQGDSITINFTNDTASVDLAVSSTSGTFATSSNEDKAAFSISTDNASGYTLSISADDDTGELVSSDSSLSSITSAISSATFDDSSYNGKWGYLPSKYNSTNNTSYLPSPTTDVSILDITNAANATANNYTIALGARADMSSTIGTYSKTFTLSSVANINPESCNNSKLCIEYDANGLYYVNPNTTMNRVNYNSTTTSKTVTKYAHMSNVGDDGIATGDLSAISTDAAIDDTQTITIDGAETLTVTLYYDTYASSSYGYVSVYQSPFDMTNSNDRSISTTTGNVSGRKNGNKSGKTSTYTTWNSSTYSVTGDTVKFHFYRSSTSTSHRDYYGYYAIITGTSVINTRTVASGAYVTPTGTNTLFHGWSSSQTTAGTGLPSSVEYTNESEVISKMPGNEGESKTLYAVWQQGYSITFNKDSNVSSITVLDSDGNTVGTITSSGQSLVLYQGNSYAIKPTYATGYVVDTIIKTSGAGALSGNNADKKFTVGAGTATISITSKVMQPMQNWTGCSSLAVGDTEEVYDTRDNEVYLIGKLKDGKCWMLENLNLAGGTALLASDTDVDSSYITSFTTSNNLTKSGDTIVLPASDNSSSSFSANNYSYVYNSGNKTSNCTSPGCYSYYSWDAATLGSGRAIGTDNTDAPHSICPKGWKLPTTRTTDATNWQTTSDFYVLAHQYGLNSTTNTYENNGYFNFYAGPGTTPNFLPAGIYNSGPIYYVGSGGFYWSATSYPSMDRARHLDYTIYDVYSATDSNRSEGASVRCLLMSETTYTLNYDKNTTDNVSNMPSSQSYGPIQDDRRYSFTLPTDKIPSRSGYTFMGWGTSSDQAEPTYKYENGTFTPSEATVYANDNPETLYAIWQVPREITFNVDSNVSSVQILDPSGNVVSTVTTTGTNVNLMEPVTYTIKPTHTTNYMTDTITKTSGVGTLNGEEFTVGAGTATIDITSREMPILYDEVATLSKGKNTDSNSHFSWTSITTPTSTDPSTDTSTSGVFEWDGMTAGNGIDSNGGTQKIYFYRGILETSAGSGTYGSDGSANAYPNYVKLANNTCWRIVRTTSTGGVKMMYNGMWNSSTSTCANAQSAAQLTTSKFNDTSATVSGTTYTGLQYQNIHAVGYTYSSLAASTTTATPISTIFGSTGNDTTTNTNSSIIKQYLDSWYSTNMADYTNKLEGDAGYCNDRTLNTGTSWTTPLADSTKIVPYGTTVTRYYFGSYPRNANSSTFSPILTCPRGKVDLYSYTSNAGNGNGQLDHPVALLTADEASLAGNGYSNSYSAYNANSYLRSGSLFWLLSPINRDSDGFAIGFLVASGGDLNDVNVSSPLGVRPVISLAPGTRVLGSGTATDPWVVQ